MTLTAPEWRECSIGDLVTLQRGYDLPEQNRVPGDIPIYGSAGITGFHDKARAKAPGVTVGRSGASFGVVNYVPRDFWPHNAVLFVTDFKGNDPRFVSFLLKTIDFASLNSGSAQQSLNRNFVYPVRTRVPLLRTQFRIAAILSAYDDLIENNLRRMAVLEEMARSLYREWFVEFRFPSHERARFVDSTFGKIPRGWDIGTLGDFLTRLESGRRPKGGVRDVREGVPSVGAENIHGIGRHEFNGEKFVSREFFESMGTGHARDRDVAIYKDGAYIGRSTYFRDGFPHQTFCVNEHVFLVRGDRVRLTQGFLYLWLQEPDTVHTIRSANANSAQPGINQQIVRALQLMVPDQQTAAAFEELVEPLFALLISLAKKNRVLRRTRDLLLPRLISGELDVSDLDIEAESMPA